MPFIR